MMLIIEVRIKFPGFLKKQVVITCHKFLFEEGEGVWLLIHDLIAMAVD